MEECPWYRRCQENSVGLFFVRGAFGPMVRYCNYRLPSSACLISPYEGINSYTRTVHTRH